MIKRKRDDPLWFLDEDRGGKEQLIFQETKASFDPALILVSRYQFLIRERLALQFIGPDNETGLAQRFFVHPRLVDGDRHHDLPLVGRRARLLVRTPLACMARMSYDVMVNLQPRRLALEFPLQGRPCICFTGKAAHTQMPALALPTSLSTADLPLQRSLCSLL